jgi:AcrR family transcriptional regulator
MSAASIPSASLSPHRQRKRAAMVARILDTARAIMREEGVAALSMQELARRLDMRAPSLYNYFSSKMDIYDALFQQGIGLYDEHLEAALQGARSWQDEVSRALQAYLEFSARNPELFQLCFQRPVPGFVPSEESLRLSFGMLQRYHDRVGQWLPELDTNFNQEQIGDLIIAIIHGLTALQIANEPGVEIKQGRFGSLIPVVMDTLRKAWEK